MKKKLAEAQLGGGGGEGVDMDALRDMFACKSPPDSTIVRIEELEKFQAEVASRVINHDMTLYQNSTLNELTKDESKNKINQKINKARVSSADRRMRASAANGFNNAGAEEKDGSQEDALAKVFDEIEALNNNDYCITTRIQRLE